MTPTPLGPGVEFDLIRRLTAGIDDVPPGVEVGPGDDAAILEGGWLVSTDLAVEDVHFRRGWLPPDELGGRATRAAISDLAAMAASPVGVFLSLAGSPADHRDGTLEAVGRGARAAAAACGAALLGGDVTRSPGPLVIDVVVLGRAPRPVRRNGARPGHELWVTGRLGAAAAVVACLGRGDPVPPPDLRRFARPAPRLAEARWLAATGRVHALIDLSDGLAGDAGHVSAASGVGIEIDGDAVPVDPRVEALLGPGTGLPTALSGGEDYELLLAADAGLPERVDEFERAFPGVELTRVGRVVEGDGVRLRSADGSLRPLDGAFDHFADDDEGAGS